MALTGYPPEDLLFRRGFVERNEKELDGLARHSKGLVALVGYVESARGSLYNAAALLADGSMKASYRKMELPNYGVFDETLFQRENACSVSLTRARRLGSRSARTSGRRKGRVKP